jgi:orotidine-5'-phosphate decarboxylase
LIHSNPVCLALDSPDRARVLELASATAEHVGMFKVGLTAFTALGPGIVAELSQVRPVFLDLKLHDIPAQVEGAVAAAVTLGASYTTIHAAAGAAAMEAAVSAAGESCRVLAVTLLTSLDESDLVGLGIAGSAEQAVARLAETALGAGAPGLVCSPHEVASLRKRFGSRPILVVPGVRPAGAGEDDQKRTRSPRVVATGGGVVFGGGRPFSGAAFRGAAAHLLLEELRA